jgi:hypothetical protein
MGLFSIFWLEAAPRPNEQSTFARNSGPLSCRFPPPRSNFTARRGMQQRSKTRGSLQVRILNADIKAETFEPRFGAALLSRIASCSDFQRRTFCGQFFSASLFG